MPKRLLGITLAFCLLIGVVTLNAPKSYSDELDDINKQLSELTDALNKSVAATKPLESQLNSLKQQITGIKNRVTSIEADLVLKKKNIDDGYKNLGEKEKQFNAAVREYYIKSYYQSPLAVILSAASASELTQILAYQRIKTNQDKALITNIALSITDLETRREKLKSEQEKMLAIKTTLDDQSAKLDKVVQGAKNYQAEVSGKIADLSAKQQQIINAKSGNFTFTIGSGELADEYLSSIKGFNESAPSGSFAVFSFGAYTHRKGMSQYGARGRAQAGQNYKDILQKYYGKQPVGKDTGGTIKVAGQGEIDFEGRYLMGIAEMPSTWHPEALKSQAIAARTYAYRYKIEGKEICTNEACQVFSSSKADNPPDAWKQAVEATRGEIIEDVVTYYSSTAGGYLATSGWDTTTGNGGSNFIDVAYEKAGGSPWLYKAWWREHYSNSGATCGRSNPWLSPQEMADIVNAAIALRTPGIDTGRITPVTTGCWGGNPYSMDELRNLVSSHGGIATATSVSVSQGNGTTTNVTINGVSLSGEDFKRAFNLRGPGYIRIPQTGFAFFNIEHK